MSQWGCIALGRSFGKGPSCTRLPARCLSPSLSLSKVYPMFGYDKSNEMRGKNVNILIPVR